MTFSTLFPNHKPIIGMVHLLPLPGTPAYGGNIDAIYEQAEWEATTLAAAGADAFIVENLNDEPYLIGEPLPEQLALMAGITKLISRQANVPVGVNVQFNAWQAEVAIAHTCGADFIRVEVFVDTVMMAQGLVNACSAQITRYRRSLGAQGVQLWADIQTKYTTNLVSQPLTQSAIDAQAAGADALIVTGAATGQSTPLEAVAEVKQVVGLPVLVGSGTNIDNVAQVLTIADGAIVGSSLKEGGSAQNKISKAATAAFMKAARS
ncbi:MAG: BtpA/SgcQ family protein [Chloroflexota bacterium]